MTHAHVVQLTVEYHADPRLPDDIAQQLLDATIDAVNEIGYVSNVQVLPTEENE